MAEQLHRIAPSRGVAGPQATADLPYADVVVSVPTTAPDDAFTYAVPADMDLEPGHLVRVPFGRRYAYGVVVGRTGQMKAGYAKPVQRLVFPEPLLTPKQLDLGRWVSGYYQAHWFAALAPMLPPGFRTPTQAIVRLVDGATDEAGLSSAAQRLLSYLRRRPGAARLATLTRLLGPWVPNVVRSLSRAGLVEVGWSEPPTPRQGRLRAHLQLGTEPSLARQWAEERASRAPKQAGLARRLADPSGGAYLVQEARREYGASAVTALLSTGLAQVQMEPSERQVGPAEPPPAETPLLLTEAQAAALREVRAALDSPSARPQVFLLQGVTGSGKTEVYLQALAHCLSKGKRGIILVPELSLTPQAVARFNARFPGQVGVLHSGLTPAQQADQWWQVRRGSYPVVVGSRGAVFAPQRELGLIVLDEEHEWTYKQQDSAPHYHAREVAVRLAELTGAVVLLGSATPDVVSAYRARGGQYRLLTLPHRIGPSGATATAGMARAEVVDMRQELREGNRSAFSRSLQSALKECIGGGHQAILFLNRRGAASVVQCRSCGFVVRCWQCASPYTYHGAEGLVCHYCNRHRKMPATCPECRRPNLRYLGLGTQRVAEEVEHLLSGVRVLRWDRDTARTGRAHQELLERFTSGQADVLVGTQMVAKGLHVPAVTLVGAVLADIGLHIPDYRAAERTFQVLCQVAGRAGRGAEPGKVIIQTYLPDHYAVRSAQSQEYEAFYERELAFRRAHRYPPFGRLVRLLFGHADAATSRQEAQRMAAALKRAAREWAISHVDVVGPAPAYPPRVRGLWRWHLLLRGDNPRLLLDKVLVPPNWLVDVDPVATA
uniref:DNA 3'-5' helicase n=1 Tax=uncultured marine microorganism HF4000_APKG7H23 TaxID=455551 RepID=B3T9T3_9ZZZZ|nr:putative DEAD/DEAH box helicase [uncultured marine microorganism HF4000_APKG7H23]